MNKAFEDIDTLLIRCLYERYFDKGWIAENSTVAQGITRTLGIEVQEVKWSKG